MLPDIWSALLEWMTDTLLPNEPGGGDVYQITGAPVIPEPSTLVLATLGIVGAAVVTRGSWRRLS